MGCGASNVSAAVVPEGTFLEVAPVKSCCILSGCSKACCSKAVPDVAAGLRENPDQTASTVILRLDENLQVVGTHPSKLAFFGAAAAASLSKDDMSASEPVSLAEVLVREQDRQLAGRLLTEPQMQAHVHLVQTQNAGEPTPALLALLPAEQNWIAILHKVPKSHPLTGFEANRFSLPLMPDMQAPSQMLAASNKSVIADFIRLEVENSTSPDPQNSEKSKGAGKGVKADSVMPRPPHFAEAVDESALRVRGTGDKEISASEEKDEADAIVKPSETPGSTNSHNSLSGPSSGSRLESSLPLEHRKPADAPVSPPEPDSFIYFPIEEEDDLVNEPYLPSVVAVGPETGESSDSDEEEGPQTCVENPSVHAVAQAAQAAQGQEQRGGSLSLTDSWGLSTPSLEPGGCPRPAQGCSRGTQTGLIWVMDGWKCMSCSRPPRLPEPWKQLRQRTAHKRKTKPKQPAGPFDGFWRLQQGPADVSKWLQRFWISGKRVVTSTGPLVLTYRKGHVWLAGGEVWLTEDGRMHRRGKSGKRFVFARGDPDDIPPDLDHDREPQQDHVTGGASSSSPALEPESSMTQENGQVAAEGLGPTSTDVCNSKTHPLSGQLVDH